MSTLTSFPQIGSLTLCEYNSYVFCNLIEALRFEMSPLHVTKNVSQNSSHMSKVSYQNYEEPSIDTVRISILVRLSVVSNSVF